MRKVLILVLVGIFLLNFTSALEIDNVLRYDSIDNKISIRNALGLPNWLGGSTLAEATLNDNGCDERGRYCEAIKTITLNGEMPLVQDFKTLRLDDGSNVEQDIRWHKLEYWGEIIDYEYRCDKNKLQNGTNEDNNCQNILIGSHEGWIRFYEGDVFESGTYNVKTSGEIKPGRLYDWQIKIEGEWTTPWAIWGNISLGDQAQVILNSPEDNFLSLIPEVEFSCSANITGGAAITNISLITNQSGSFEIVNTTNSSSSNDPNFISYYFLDESSGVVIDSVGENNGTNNGATPGVGGIINTAYDFDGSNDFIDTNTDFGFIGSIDRTLTAWIFPTFASDSGRIFSGGTLVDGKKWQVNLNNGNLSIDIRGPGGGYVSSLKPILNQWNFISITLSGTTIGDHTLYLNGASENAVGGVTVNTGSGDYWIGDDPISIGVPINGRIDEVGLWNRSLSSVEIFNLYNSGIARRPIAQILSTTISDTTLWTCEACDTDGDCGFATENRTVSVDIFPPQINVESPVGLLDFNFIGGNERLNVTFTDNGLDTCWYDYSGTNITIEGCLSGIKNSTQFILEENNFNMTLYANDTLGNENSTFIEWEYRVLQNNQTFNNQTTEGNTEPFSANLTISNGLSVVVASLVYDGVNNIGTATIIGNITIISVDDVVIPGIDADINLSFFWALILSDSTSINLTPNNQTVIALGIDNCTSFSNVVINFTNLDEESQTVLENSTMEIAVNIFSADNTVLVLNISDSFTNNPTAICINEPLTNDSDYLLNVIVKYSTEDHAIEYHNIVDFILNNQTANQQVSLFDLNLTDSTDFQLTFTGSDFLPEENVLVFVERQYISENTFKTVELPKTDANGQTVLHLVRNDIIYNFRFIKDGESLGVFENIIAFCDDFTIGRCVIDLSAISNESAFENYDEVTGITYTSPPVYNSVSNIVTFSFASADGSTKTVVMRVERRDIFGNQTVCNNTIVSSSGTLFCNIGLNLTDTSLFTIISVDGNDLIFNTVIIDETSFGDVGYALWFILTLVLILMASESKNAVIFVTLISFVGALGMGWLVGGATGVGSSGVWVIIISIAALWQINRKTVS